MLSFAKEGKISLLLALITLLVVSYVLTLLLTATEPVVAQGIPFDYFTPALKAINMDELKGYIEDLVRFGSRFTGYPGCYAAADYIESKFRGFGLSSIERHSFKVPTPVDEGAYIETSLGEKVTVYPVYPNRVCPPQTPPGGLSGRLVYVGSGEYENFDGKPIEGSIVLMDFNTQYHWVTAAKFGAKAVVFLEPEYTTTIEARMKLLGSVAWNFPRVYARANESRKLLELAEKGETVTLVSNMKWRNVESYNVIGYLRGTTYPDEYVLITAAYDSFSFIPSLAPGSREAIGTAIMLQLAKFFAANPGSNKYTLVFIAFSGTNQGIIGSRWFVKEYVDNRWSEWGSKIKLQINIDINDINKYLMPYLVLGWTFGWNEGVAPWLTNYQDWLFNTLLPDLAERFNRPYLAREDPAIGRPWIPRDMFGSGGPGHGIVYEDYYGSPLRYANSEPLLVLGGPGMTWGNLWAFSNDYWTPFDLPDTINWDNIKFKIEALYPIIYATVNTDLSGLIGSWAPKVPGQFYPKWVDVSGKTMEYNVYSGWWDIPVSNAIIVYNRGGPSSLGSRPFQLLLPAYAMSDEDGDVYMPGLIQQERLMGGNYGLEAYVVDEETGNVKYAPGFGTYWFRGRVDVSAHISSGFSANTYDREQSFGIYTLFKCGTITLFDICDVYYRSGASDQNIALTVNDFASHAPPDQWSWDFYLYGGYSVSVAAAFVPPDKPVEFLVHTTYTKRYPMLVLTNSSDECLSGAGFKIGECEQYTITYTTLKFAQDMRRLNLERIKTLSAGGITPSGYTNTEDIFAEALLALENHEYSKIEVLSNRLVVYERNNYSALRASIEDAIYAITFFGLTLVPFSILIERLLFQYGGMRRVMVTFMGFVVPLAFLSFVHPGFRLATDPIMVIIGFLVVVLIMPLIAVILNTVLSAIKRLRIKVAGVHWVEIPRFSVALLGFSTGVSHMRKRKLLTGLTLAAVILVTSSTSAFTSLGSLKVINEVNTGRTALYDGILFHHQDYSNGGFGDFSGLGGSQSVPQVGERFLAEFKALYGDKVIMAPRAWAYIGYSMRGTCLLNANSLVPYDYENRKAVIRPVRGFLGMTPEEKDITSVDKAIINGTWFTENMADKPVAIISNKMAKGLGVKLFDTISVSGLNLKVVGIFDDDILFGLKDLDDLELTIWDDRVPGYSGRVAPDELVIIPYKTLLIMCKGWIVSVAIKFKPEYADKNSITQVAREIYKQTDGFLPIPLYMGIGGIVWTLSPQSIVTIFGWQQQIIPVVISSMVILGLMISSIEERRREIHVLSTVGLSPFHVAFLFLSESIAYSIVGGILGYMLSIIMAMLGGIFGAGGQLNYASTTVVTAVSIMMLAILGVTVYPVIKASRMITPSLERRWKVSPPKGDVWEVTLPFFVTEDEEANGVLSYIHELLMGHLAEDSETFRLKPPIKFMEQKDPKMHVRALAFESLLAPYDLGITQHVELLDVKSMETKRHNFSLHVKRLAGPRGSWITFGKEFIDLIRKQVLLWRSFRPDERAEYQNRFRDLLLKMEKVNEQGEGADKNE
ncbi:M28 family peptidase [Candidatus Bathyarchaeota archaeon]|nr:M28 family peptidase [Candidatus Bathyarchaeota archaeon]